MPVYTPPAPPMVKQRVHWIDHLAYAALALVALILVGFLAAPLLAILQQALLGKSGDFIWFDNFIEYAKRRRCSKACGTASGSRPWSRWSPCRWPLVLPMRWRAPACSTRRCSAASR
jgi:hypothetical protein